MDCNSVAVLKELYRLLYGTVVIKYINPIDVEISKLISPF